MNNAVIVDMTHWETIGHWILAFLIGSETFAAIGAPIWATLSYAGLGKTGVYITVAISGAVALAAAIWIYRRAKRQWIIQQSECRAARSDEA